MESIPIEVLELANRWSFAPLEELPGGHCSRVFADKIRVLKMPFQGEEAISGWKMALRLSESVGPKVFEYDPDSGALLMERILPGKMLSDENLSEGECFELFLQFNQEVKLVSTDGLLPLEKYFSKSSPLLEKLLETQPAEVPLHGDLHHDNILLGPDGWKLIDPKGLRGDPAFEVIAFLRNPIERLASEPDLVGLLRNRILEWSQKLEFSASRIWGWASVDAEIDPEPSDEKWGRVREALQKLEPEFGLG